MKAEPSLPIAPPKGRPRTIFWWLFALFFGIFATRLTLDYLTVWGEDVEELASWQLVLLYGNPWATYFTRAISAAFWAILIALPVDAVRRWAWRQKQKRIPPTMGGVQSDKPH